MMAPFFKRLLILISDSKQPSKTVNLGCLLFRIIKILLNLVSLTFNLSQDVQTLRGWRLCCHLPVNFFSTRFDFFVISRFKLLLFE